MSRLGKVRGTKRRKGVMQIGVRSVLYLYSVYFTNSPIPKTRAPTAAAEDQSRHYSRITAEAFY